jgi:hypothetical protein
MTSVQLTRNMLLQASTVPVVDPVARLVVRILWIEPARVAEPRVAVIDTSIKKTGVPEWWDRAELLAGIEGGLYEVLQADPYAASTAVDDASLTEKQLATRDFRWGVIRGLVTDPDQKVLYEELRGPLIRSAATRYNTSLKSVRHFLSLYWQRGQIPNALLPAYDKCGCPGKHRATAGAAEGPKRGRPRKPVEGKEHIIGRNVDDRTHRLLVLGARKFHEKEKRSPEDAYHETLKTYFAIGHEVGSDGNLIFVIPPEDECPTFDQFWYHYEQERDREKAVINLKGVKRYLLESRPLLGDPSQRARGPGAVFEVDATRADITLVSALRRHRTIGRPLIFFVRDVFSRVIVGFYVCLEGPNWAGLKRALECTFTDKVAWCRRLGREIAPEEWTSAHLCDVMLGDRAPGELLSANSDFLLTHFGIRADSAPPSRPDYKPVVENSFDLINDEGVGWAPGAVQGPRQRGERDNRLTAAHTVWTFTQLLLEIVLYYNNYHWLKDYEPDAEVAYEGVPHIAAELWKWGIANRSSALRQADPEKVRLSLMRSVGATTTRRGFYVPGLKLHYTCSSALDAGMFIGERGRKRTTVELGMEDHDVSVAYLRTKRGTAMEPCKLHPRYTRFVGKARDEVLDERAVEAALARDAKRSGAQGRVNYLERINRINQEAVDARDEALRQEGKDKLVIGTRADRKEDRDLHRRQELRNGKDAVPRAGMEEPEAGEGSELVPMASEITLLQELELEEDA